MTIREDEMVVRLWNLHRRGVSYASDTPAVNMLLADMAEGIGEAATMVRALSSEREILRERIEAVRRVIEGGFERKMSKVDGREQCEHGQFGYEDCIACYDEALLAALDTGVTGG